MMQLLQGDTKAQVTGMSRFKTWLGLLAITFLAASISVAENYYAFLGVSREASTRDIRRAFKKLALAMHPDKNPNDQDAYDRFHKASQVYEVLKDDDLRMNYERFGEKGLEESNHSSGYETYDFYRNDFGIYDDDLEVITLDSREFDATVNSGELWFVNFYLPRCPHCHDLAPTWREFAKEMDGLVRIGVVNCEDSKVLCHSNGVRSYPTLLVFKEGTKAERYFGNRSKESLAKFAMRFVNSKVTELWHGNVFNEIEVAFASGIGWLITFCAETGDCLSSTTRHKLAGMLQGLVNVGWMDCIKHADLCENFEVTFSSTAYFPPSSTMKQRDSMLFLRSLDVKEIYTEVMHLLPDLETLTVETFSGKVARHRWVVSFLFGLEELPFHEYKKLRVLLKDYHMQVGKVNCVTEADLCSSLHIQKPSIAVFKGLGIDNFEIHHGGNVLYKAASFAKDSASSHVTSLRPGNFPGREKEPWLVYFFVPWCLPCFARLPELRKASVQLFGQVKFGTLDCAAHEELCKQYDIHTFPTMMVFNQSNISEFEGYHTAEGVMEFLEYLANPAVVTLTPDSFQKLVKQRGPDETWLVAFSTPWCQHCLALLPEWRKLAQMVNGIVKVGTVDCDKHWSFCRREDVLGYPEIRLFPQNASRWDQHQSYTGWNRDSQSLRSWVFGSLPRVSQDLTPEDLRRWVYAGKQHWVIDFYTPWCVPCQQFAPEFELLAHVMKGSVRAGRLDCQAHAQACERAGINAYPTIRFYPYLGSAVDQGGEDINSRDANGITRVLRQRLQQLSADSQSKFSKVKDEL
ncbi:dnaJ homolog subfamily C member 10 isoform X2 [Brienomyrus brachyistius]|uniref:dnaJ homolog subfamily C member 10 isoform X2 n=1 Tax=Brienomyrus brachyistius TaxID=42636 RepID=UPI0020B301DF|nr:dnaJ homolog subfamily C member 10 isoform X2 [Brienomyrus brachyistius]